MMPAPKTTIYALTDPSGDVRYVGKTAKTAEERLTGHLQEAKSQDHYRARWLKSLQRKGVQPGVIVLEVVEEADANSAERTWIAHFRRLVGKRLTNGTEGGTGGRQSPEVNKKRIATMREKYKTQPGPFTGKTHSPETKKKMSEAAKRRIARGESHLCDPEHQRKAGARSRSGYTPEQTELAAKRLRLMAKSAAEARWGRSA